MKTNYKKLLLLFLFIMGLIWVQAQSAVVPTGGDASGSGGRASYTVGQVAYSTATGSNGTSTQGVQQPYEFFIVGIDKNPGINLQLVVYPNPTPSKVTLNIGELDPFNLRYQLYDAGGKLLKTEALQDRLTSIPMETLSSGTYILKVLNDKTELRTFKIIKK